MIGREQKLYLKLRKMKLFEDIPKNIILNKEFDYYEVDRKFVSKEEIDLFYEDSFYENEKTDYLQSAWGEDKDWYMLQWNIRLDFFISNYPDYRDAKVLDIGTGPGTFLEACKLKNLNPVGTDTSPNAINFIKSKGFNGIKTKLEKGDFESSTFDFIHSSEVLEHLYDPKEVLEKSYDLLKPGGIICISVPNDFSRVQSIANKIVNKKNKYWWINEKHHLNYFSNASINNLLKASGFQILDNINNFPLDIYIILGKNYIDNPELGKECHNLRKEFEFDLYEKGGSAHLIDFYKNLTKSGLGRNVVVFARK